MNKMQARCQLLSSEVLRMDNKLSSVQQNVDTTREDLGQLKSLVTSLERLTSLGEVEDADLRYALVKTQLDSLTDCAKTLPSYYPSKELFSQTIATLKDVLACKEFVNSVTTERVQLLRDHEALRNEVRLVSDENEKLKRRHRRDRNMIADLMERLDESSRGYAGVQCSGGSRTTETTPLYSKDKYPCQGRLETRAQGHIVQKPVSDFQEDLELIGMLQEMKAILRNGDRKENQPAQDGRSQEDNRPVNREYDDILRNLREVVAPAQSTEQVPQQSLASMKGFFGQVDHTIALLEQELNDDLACAISQDQNNANNSIYGGEFPM